MNDAPWTGGGESGQAHTGSSRRLDGKPETDRDRRFFDLRESGYSGGIDQDGYPADVVNGKIVRL